MISTNIDFLNIISNNDIDLLQHLLINGLDPNFIYKNIDSHTSEPLLIIACIKQNISFIKLLIKFGANINISGSLGSPLFYAILANNLDIIGILLSFGATFDYIPFISLINLFAFDYSAHIPSAFLEIISPNNFDILSYHFNLINHALISFNNSFFRDNIFKLFFYKVLPFNINIFIECILADLNELIKIFLDINFDFYSYKKIIFIKLHNKPNTRAIINKFFIHKSINANKVISTIILNYNSLFPKEINDNIISFIA